jgi:hypothetical protein
VTALLATAASFAPFKRCFKRRSISIVPRSAANQRGLVAGKYGIGGQPQFNGCPLITNYRNSLNSLFHVVKIWAVGVGRVSAA